jgi:hypothetical protein
MKRLIMGDATNHSCFKIKESRLKNAEDRLIFHIIVYLKIYQYLSLTGMEKTNI